MHEIIPVTYLSEKQRKSFFCGVDALDEYFHRFAKGNHLKNLGKTFVLLEDQETIIGYYTTSMGSVTFQSLPLGIRERIPKYPIPIARIARLAINKNKQRKGWGEFLLIDALRRIREATSSVAAYGVVVDAKDENAKAFYMKFGFIPFLDNEFCLILPISIIPKAV